MAKQVFQVEIILKELEDKFPGGQVQYCATEEQAIALLEQASQAFLANLRTRPDVVQDQIEVEPGGGGCWLKVHYWHGRPGRYYSCKNYFDFDVVDLPEVLEPGQDPGWDLMTPEQAASLFDLSDEL